MKQHPRFSQKPVFFITDRKKRVKFDLGYRKYKCSLIDWLYSKCVAGVLGKPKRQYYR